MFFEFVGNDNSKQLVKISKNTSENYIEYEIIPSNETGNSFEGLFNIICNSIYQNLYVYSNKNEELVATFTLNCMGDLDTDLELFLSVNEGFNLSPDSDVIEILSSKKMDSYSIRWRKKMSIV